MTLEKLNKHPRLKISATKIQNVKQIVINFKKHLPRLDKFAYIGYKHVFFTSNCYNRNKTFVKKEYVELSKELLKKKLKEFECECIIYVFMPDHVHMMLHGNNEKSDLLNCHNDWKGESGKRLSELINKKSVSKKINTDINRIWQPQSYDHVLRSYEYERGALRNIINYILLNPIRAGLVDVWQEYPFLGSMIGENDIRHPYWWDWFYEM